MGSGSVLPVPSNPVSSAKSFYVEQTSQDTFDEIKFIEAGKEIEFTCRSHIIISDGADIVEFSYDGTTVHGEIKTGEKLDFLDRQVKSIFIKSKAASTPGTLRIYAW